VNESDGDTVQTGEPITFNFVHNTDSATAMFGLPDKDSPFDRGYEPSGQYVSIVDDEFTPFSEAQQTGTITLNNPLVVDLEGWKQRLSEQYNGLTGKELSKAVIADGYDGIVTTDGKYISEIVNFNTFDESRALYQSEVPNLAVIHNIRSEGVEAAEELGGLAAPSIAVTNIEKGGFTNFGEISLLANPDILNDPTVRTFDADIYSARQPRSVDKLNTKKVRALLDDIETVNEGTGLRNIYEIQEISDLDKDSVFNYWLSKVGKKPTLKKVEPNDLSKSVDDVADNDLLYSDELKQAVAVKYNNMIEQMLGENPTDAERELVLDVAGDWFDIKIPSDLELRKVEDKGYAYFRGDEQVSELYSGVRGRRVAPVKFRNTLKESGNYELDYTSPKFNLLQESVAEVRRIRDGFDQGQYTRDLMELNHDKQLRADFKKWLNDTYKGLVTKKQLFKGYTPAGDRKYAEYTLNNIVREMTRTLTGGEGMNYGVASVRSRFANELSSKEKVQAVRDKIVTAEEMDAIKEQAAVKFEKALEQLKPYYKFDTDGWGYGSDVAEAITQGPKEVREAFGTSKEALSIINDLGKYLASLPTEYFEAKAQRAVKFSEFDIAIVPNNTPNSTIDILKSHGLRIQKYDPDIKGSRNDVVSQQTKLLFQETRGSVTFTPNNEAIIRLGQASDLSTFIHESGHLFLEMEGKFAKEFGITEDQQTILDWLGVESFDDIQVEQHEQFARGFEAYTREGKAPSIALRDAFAAFRRWLLRIYRDIAQLNVNLTDDVRGVMDRMLATEREIEEALSAPNYEELFRSKEQAGMTDAEWEKYQKTLEKRRNAATQTIDEKLLKEYTRRKTQEWNEEKAPLVEQERERLSQLPVYQIMSDARQFPMDFDALKEQVGVEKLPGKFIGLAKKDGIDPQEYAETYGYNNVTQMYNAIVDAQPLKKAADEAAEAIMVQKYGDILNDGSIEAEVREAVHNEEQASLLLQELNALKPPRAQAINTQQIKLNARNTISKMKYAEIKPNKYNRAEIRAAQNAARATSKEEQYQYKLQQVVNHHLYREAIAAREAMIKQRKYIRGVQKREYSSKQIAPEYITNMKLIANMYDMRQKPAQTMAIEQVLTWYQTQMNDPNDFAQLQLLDVNLVRALAAQQAGELATFELPTFDDLTVEDLQSTYDMLRHLRHVGGQMSDVAKAEFQQEVDVLSASIEQHGGRDVKDRAGLPGKHTDLKRKMSHLINLIPSLRNLMRKLDGFGDGAAYDSIYRRIEDAQNKKLELGVEMFKRFETELKDIHKIGLSKKDHKTYITDDGMEIDITSEHRFMMALYWGTESSRDAIRDGWNLTDSDVSRILADMPDEQIDLLNAVWKVNESMWPELSAASTRLYGVAPPKLTPTPFSINGKQLTGGHMRLFYDSSELEMKSEQEDAAKMSTIVPSRAGSLYERVGSGGRAPLLDVNNMVRAIEDNVHFIAFAEAGRTVAALMNNNGVKDVMERKHGRGFRKALVQNLENITSNRPAIETLPVIPQVSRLVRHALTMKYLAYSLRNAIQGLPSIKTAMDEVGFTPFVGAFTRFVSPSSHKETISFVQERSAFMKNRSSVINREASEYLNKVKITGRAGHAWDLFRAYGFTPQTIIDSFIAYPAWIAKYESAMMDHGDEQRAASQADTAVAESVGSGSDLHLGAAMQQNNTEFVKTMTVFGSWFNNYYQRIYKSTEAFTDFRNRETLQALITTPFVIATLSALLIMDFPDADGDDDEQWGEWMLKRYTGFMAGTVPLLRDINSAFGGFTPKTPLSSVAELPKRLTDEIGAAAEDRQTPLKTASDIINLTTTVVPVPGAGNVTRVMNFIDSDMQGNETGSGFEKTYQALVEGPNRN
jgi:hypothetical protein